MSKFKPANTTAGWPFSNKSYAQSILPDEPHDPTIGLTPAQRAKAAGWTPVNPADRLTPHAPSLNFDPPEEQANRIFASFYDQYFSFSRIAFENDTTVEALSAWLARADIAQRMDNLATASAARFRLVAVDRLHHALDACTIILQEYKDAACHAAAIEEGRGGSPSEHNRRDRETARKTSLLMLRFARFEPYRTRVRAGTTHSPRDHYTPTSTITTTVTFNESIPTPTTPTPAPTAHPDPASTTGAPAASTPPTPPSPQPDPPPIDAAADASPAAPHRTLVEPSPHDQLAHGDPPRGQPSQSRAPGTPAPQTAPQTAPQAEPNPDPDPPPPEARDPPR